MDEARQPRRRAIPGVVVLGLALSSSILASEACRAPTQVTLSIGADQATCAQIRELAITVGTDPEATEDRVGRAFYSTVTTPRCDGAGSIGTLVLTPNDESSRGAIVVLAALEATSTASCTPANGYAGCIVARRTFSFVEHESLTLPVSLAFDCLNVPCSARSTCRDDACVSSETACEGSDCGRYGVAADGAPAIVDAPTTNDATASDAGPDGSGPEACSLHDVPPACSPYSSMPVPCPGLGCCTYGGYGYGYGGTGGGAGTCADSVTCATVHLGCAGAMNCRAGEVCCLFANQNETRCAPPPCKDTQGLPVPRACLDRCECPGGACVPGPAGGGSAFVRRCTP